MSKVSQGIDSYSKITSTHSPGAAFEAGRQRREEQGPKSNVSLCPQGHMGCISRTFTIATFIFPASVVAGFNLSGRVFPWGIKAEEAKFTD